MRAAFKALLLLALILVAAAAAGVAYITTRGLGARDEPGAIETFLAGQVRQLAVARSARGLTNPVSRSPQVIESGLAHYADHCASCHANDGSGSTTMGRSMYPRAPDMRRRQTQDLSDGELFWIIENGIRFTGMPAWSTGKEGEEASWHLVHFIRYLPDLTPADLEHMATLNPKPPAEIRQQMEEEEFLSGGRNE